MTINYNNILCKMFPVFDEPAGHSANDICQWHFVKLGSNETLIFECEDLL